MWTAVDVYGESICPAPVYSLHHNAEAENYSIPVTYGQNQAE